MTNTNPKAVAMVAQAVHARRMAKQAQLQKTALGAGGARPILSRLSVLMNPRLKNKTALKWLKPFVKRKTVRTNFRGRPEEVAAGLERAYRAAGMPTSGAGSAVSGSVSGSVPGELARLIAEGRAAYKNVDKSRLSIGRLAAALGGTAALGGAGYGLARGGSKPAPAKPATGTVYTPAMATDKVKRIAHMLALYIQNNPAARNALIGAAAGGLGTAALSGGSATDRILKGLAGAAVGGGLAAGGTYAAPYLQGLLDQYGMQETQDQEEDQ